jgi:prepilin-type N-terminal cleavage/methylation domain-containing protein
MSSNAEFGMRNGELNRGKIQDPGRTPQSSFFSFIPHSAFRIPNSQGFTLLEVLIAVAIMSAIVTVIYTSFSTTSRNVQQAEEIRDSADLARTLLAKLSDDIANAYVNARMNTPAVLTVFYGKKGEAELEDEKIRRDAISVTTLTNVRTPGSKETDLWEVGYFFKQKPDSPSFVLMRREKRVLRKEEPALEGGLDPYEVTERVESLTFRYFDTAAQKWVDEWDSRTRGALTPLPKAVEITLALDDGSSYITEVEVGAAGL